MSPDGHDRLGRAMAGTRLEFEEIDFAEEIAKRDQLGARLTCYSSMYQVRWSTG
jgi:hypothetical protein